MAADALTASRRPWFALQINPRAGAGAQPQIVRDFLDTVRSLGGDAQSFTDRTELDATVRAMDQQSQSTQPRMVALVAGGGDGTVLDLLNRHPQRPIGLLPLGTENLFAKFLGIPVGDGRRAAEIAMRGHLRTVDVASVTVAQAPEAATGLSADTNEPRQTTGRFLIMASVGFDAAVVAQVHAQRRGHITRLQYLWSMLGQLWAYRAPRLQVWCDDAPAPLLGGLVVVANLPAYALGLPVVPTADGADGLLDVRVFPAHTRWQVLQLLWRIPLRRHERDPSVGRARCRSVRIESDIPAALQVDGDPLGLTPATLSLSGQSLIVLEP